MRWVQFHNEMEIDVASKSIFIRCLLNGRHKNKNIRRKISIGM